MLSLFRSILVFSLSAVLVSCAAEPLTDIPAPPRDLKAASAKLAGATVLDVDLFKPVATIGSQCASQPLQYQTVISDKLSEALASARTYSEAQKGVGLIVLKNGKIIHESYADGVTAQAPTDSYSMHKSVLALIIGIAIDEGIIRSIDDPIGQYIDEWSTDPRGKITIKQMLNMESGLILYSFSDPSGKSMELLLAEDINAVALDHPFVDLPGDEFRYNNVNSQIAGIVLERALKRKSNVSYTEFLEQKLWCPIGNNEAKLWLDREGGSPHYYSGLFTTPHNWARVGEVIRNMGKANGRQIVSAAWVNKMIEPSPTNPNYGLHIWLGSPHVEKRRYSQQNPLAVTHSAPYLANDVIFFDGFGGQRVYIIPSKEITIVRTGQINMAYDDSIIVNLVLEELEG
ncbi:MAG: hypothetical protein Pars2KO_04730 [Parasphingorhabdus sp.]